MDDNQKDGLRKLANIERLDEARLASSAAQSRMQKLVRTSADAERILRKVFATFQDANEIGGFDDGADGAFAEMMEIIALEAKEQAKNARR